MKRKNCLFEGLKHKFLSFQDTNTTVSPFKYLGFGFFLHAFVKTPSPTKTRPEGKLLRKHLKIKTLKDCPYLVRQGVVLRCQSNLLPGQFVEHWPQNSLRTNLSLLHVSIHNLNTAIYNQNSNVAIQYSSSCSTVKIRKCY